MEPKNTLILRRQSHWYLVVWALAFLVGCSSGSKQDKTVENLHEAYNGESTVSMRYKAYSAKATEEDLPLLANFFKALARSEEIHALNHRAAMASLGVVVEKPELDEFPNGNTRDNLIYSIAGEKWEADTMYADFIAIAEEEEQSYAKEVLTWARDTEQKHAVQLQQALEMLNAGNEDGVPQVWFVCRKCGNTFGLGTESDPCPFCDTPIEEFEIFKVLLNP